MMADSAAFGKSRRKSKVLGQITHDARTDSLFYVKIHPVTHCKLKIESAKTGVPIIHQEQVPVIVPDEKTGAGVPEDRAQIQLEKIALSKFSGVNLNAMEMARPVLVEMEADGRLRSACDLLRHGVSGPEFVEEDLEEVRRRAGRGMEVVRG